MGRCTNEVRMPLVPMTPPAADKLRAVMKDLHLI